MRLRVCVYVCTSDEFCAEERGCVSRSRNVKENRVGVARKRTECIESCENQELSVHRYSLFNINKPILLIQLQINKQPSFNKISINWDLVRDTEKLVTQPRFLQYHIH